MTQETADTVSTHIAIAFLMPRFPVQVLAQPELTTTAKIFGLFMCFLLTSTAADTILFVVNAAAAVAPLGHTISPKSGLPDSFIPQLTPPAKNPFGAVIVSFAISSSQISFVAAS
jgi:hypothetical protein